MRAEARKTKPGRAGPPAGCASRPFSEFFCVAASRPAQITTELDFVIAAAPGRQAPVAAPATRRLRRRIERDRDVPWTNSLEIAARVEAQDVRATLIKDGEHQLVRPSDMGLMLRELDDFTLTS